MTSSKITKEKIILTVLQAAFEKGSGSASLADIADNLQIKKASLYNYFSSRETMLEETRKYCDDYLHSVVFFGSALQKSAKEKESVKALLSEAVTDYFYSYEKEPLFQIYTFLESEKYFSIEAAAIEKSQYQRLKTQASNLLRTIISYEWLPSLTLGQLDIFSNFIASIIKSNLDLYLMKRKEIIMTSPGALFDTPSKDDFFIENTVLLIKSFLTLANNK
ncbi:MAG: TetR/AcrR family transcriptional regulator [Treponema sp.]|nr:TetR/AcrR family transcriptional regulator [Treponema sp.]